MQDQLWRVTDVAKFFNVSTATVYRWAESGKLPAEAVLRTPGGGLRFRPDILKKQ